MAAVNSVFCGKLHAQSVNISHFSATNCFNISQFRESFIFKASSFCLRK